jgi:hypothetical protein
MFDYLKQQLAAGYSSLGPFVGAFKGLYKTGIPPVLRNALLLDIETGGLSRWAPILQIGIADTNSLDLGADLTEQLAKGQELRVFPFANVRDDLKVDSKGNLRRPTYKVKRVPIRTAEYFQEQFGDWAFRPENEHLKLRELYEGLGGEVTGDHLRQLRSQGYLDVNGVRWHDPGRVAKGLEAVLQDAAARGMSLIAANNPFEGQRLGLFLQAWTKGDIDPIKRLFESTPAFKGHLSLMTGESSPAFQFAQSRLQSSQDFIKLRPLLNQAPKAGIRATDVQTFGRMLYAGAGKLGIAAEHADIYTGTSVELLSHSLLNKREKHAALADAMYQAEILYKYLAPSTSRLHTMALGMEEGASLLSRTKGFFAAAGGLADTTFIKSLALANQRSYVKDQMKHRNVKRTLAQLSATLDVLADNKSIPGFSYNVSSKTGEIHKLSGEFLTLTTGNQSAIEKITAEGTKYFDWNTTTRTDKQLLNDIASKAKAGASRKQLENWLLNRLMDTRSLQGYESQYTFDNLRELLDEVTSNVSSGAKTYSQYIESSSEFNTSVLKAMDEVPWGRGDYASWFTSRYRRAIGVAGLAGFSMYQMAKAGYRAMKPADSGLSQYLHDGQANPDAFGETALFESTGASILGYSESEIYRKMTQQEDFDFKTKQIFRSGNITHLRGEVQRVRSGDALAGEYYVSDPSQGISSFVDVVYQGPNGNLIPSDIKTASPRRMASIRARGADPKHKSQLNFYMAQMGASFGYLEYENRVDPSDTHRVKVEFDPERLQRDLDKLARVRSRIRSELATGKLRYEDLPTKDTMAARALQGQQEQARIQRMANRPFNPLLELQYQFNLQVNRLIESGSSYTNNSYSANSHMMAQAQNEASARMFQSNPGRFHDR